jgi:hypothetical protein
LPGIDTWKTAGRPLGSEKAPLRPRPRAHGVMGWGKGVMGLCEGDETGDCEARVF